MISKQHLRTLIAACITLLAAPPAHAAQFWCPAGSISYLGIFNNGAVQVDVGRGVWTICNISQDYSGVAQPVCQAWYATLLTQRALGQTVMLYFDTAHSTNAGNNPSLNCNDFGSYTVHVPYHVRATS